MAGTLVQVRFKLAWQNYRVGDTITPNGTLRDWLVSNGFAEVMPDKPRGVRNAAKAVEQARGALFSR